MQHGHSSNNGYILFCQWQHPQLPSSLLSQLQGADRKTAMAESGRLLGQAWQDLTSDQKLWWKRMASRDPVNFKGRMNPYILFSAVMADSLHKNAKPDFEDSGRFLGNAWKALSPSQREFFEKQVRDIWG